MFGEIFNLFLYQPLFNILIFLYAYFPGRDFGIAVILLTLLVKFIFYPLGNLAIKSQKSLTRIQPKLEEIKKKYKDNKEKLVEETLNLYKREKINPFAGIIPLLIQLPILIALYQLFLRGFNSDQFFLLYSFVPYPGQIDTFFLNLFDLSSPNLYLAILAGVAQFWQAKMMITSVNKKNGLKKFSFQEIFQKQTLYFLPLFTVLILSKIPSVIGLYWLTMSLFTIIQQYLIINKRQKNPKLQT